MTPNDDYQSPEGILAMAEEIIADDIKAKKNKLTQKDLDYHAKIRKDAE